MKWHSSVESLFVYLDPKSLVINISFIMETHAKISTRILAKMKEEISKQVSSSFPIYSSYYRSFKRIVTLNVFKAGISTL